MPLLGITLVSCIRDEALNAEADILTCTVPGDILKRDPIIENNKVVLMVTADADLTHQAPEFTLTPGATISPLSGTERNFQYPTGIYCHSCRRYLEKSIYNISDRHGTCHEL